MREPRHTVYFAACAAMFVFGIVLALPGTVLGLHDVVDRLGMTLAQRGALISMLFLGLLAGSLVSGPVVDAVGHRAVLGGSASLIALCLPLFAAASSYPLAAAALAAIGFASAGVNTASNALSSDLFPDERGRRMNGLAIAVGIGGLSVPASMALLAGYLPWTAVVNGGAVLAAAVAIAVTRIHAAPVARATVTAGPTHARLTIKSVLRQAGLGSVALLVALGAGTEASMAGFTSTYLVAVGFTPAAATWALAAHWVGLIVGRLVFAGRVDRDKLRSIMVAALGGAAAILALVAPSSSPILAAAPFATGVAIAIIVPTTLALGGERYPRNAGTLFGMLLTVAQVGGIAFPAILGVTAEAAGVRAAMLIAVINNLVIAGICLKAARPMHRRTGGATVEPRLPGD